MHFDLTTKQGGERVEEAGAQQYLLFAADARMTSKLLLLDGAFLIHTGATNMLPEWMGFFQLQRTNILDFLSLWCAHMSGYELLFKTPKCEIVSYLFQQVEENN